LLFIRFGDYLGELSSPFLSTLFHSININLLQLKEFFTRISQEILSINVWVNFNTFPTAGRFTSFVCKDNDAGNDNKWIFGYATDYNEVVSNQLFFIY
jgi:hypothetical protein